MNNEIEIFSIEHDGDFDDEVERFIKKKKFFKLEGQIDALIEQFERGEFEGKVTAHSDVPVPYDVYKMRLPNDDTQVGKSNGYRVIYLVVTHERVVVVLTIYYKKEKATVSDKYIKGLIDGYFLNRLPEEGGDDL